MFQRYTELHIVDPVKHALVNAQTVFGLLQKKRTSTVQNRRLKRQAVHRVGPEQNVALGGSERQEIRLHSPFLDGLEIKLVARTDVNILGVLYGFLRRITERYSQTDFLNERAEALRVHDGRWLWTA